MALAAAAGRTAEHLRLAGARRSQRGELVRAMRHVTGHLDPVVDEHRLHLRKHRSLDLEMGVSPMRRVLSAAGPLLRHAHTASEAGAAVDDQQLAVRALVQGPEMGPVGWMELSNRDVCRRQGCDQTLVVHLRAAYPVQQDMDPHTLAGPLGQCIGELAADVA